MHLTDVRVDRFGSLINTAVENLSRQITVFHGVNGCGKTTFVRFLRGLFHGFDRHSGLAGSALFSESGYLRIQTPSGIRTLRRSWTSAGSEQLTVADGYDHMLAASQDNQLPAWVTDDVFREVFSPGHEEADRFDLLTRLCLESGLSSGTADAELRQAEAALLQTGKDRDGNGVEGGVVHRISELRRRQGELQGEISVLRKPASDLPARIMQLVREVEWLSVSVDRIDVRIGEIDAEIARLELYLIELRQCNLLPLNLSMLEEEIRSISAKCEKWREIRNLIAGESKSHELIWDETLRSDDPMWSVRAIVSRLEVRAESLTEQFRNTKHTEVEFSRDVDTVRQLRGEIAALCQYSGLHERTMARQAVSIQARLTDRCLNEAQRMEQLLEEQLAVLRAELARAENVLSESAVPKVMDGCRFSGHSDGFAADLSVTGIFKSMAEGEAQIFRLRSERSKLASERASHDESRSSKKLLLDRLRHEIAAASSLEQLDALRAQIAEIDAEINLLEDQRQHLDRTETSLREVLVRLRARGNSRVFGLASQYIHRLTEGECQTVGASLPDRLLIHSVSHAEPMTLGQLGRATRDQVGLALRLALIQVRGETHGHVPLILDDVFVGSDDARRTATVRLLTEIAQQGQQIIFLTSQQDVRDTFARFHADVRPFGTRIEIPATPVQPPSPVVLHAYVEPKIEAKPSVVEPIVYLQPAAPQPLIQESVPTNPTNWLFYLEVDHGVEDLAGITLGELEALRSAGILTIDDMLTRTVPQLEESTRQKGFLLSVDRLQALRGQAELTTRVPMLRRSDAALLFASGIRSVEELSKLRPETVYDRVSEFQRSEVGSRFRRGGRLIDRQQAINWARFGQFTRSLEEARHSHSRFVVRPVSRSHTPTTQPRVTSAGARPDSDASPQKNRMRRRVAEDLSTEERRARRQARRKQQVSRLRTEVAESVDDESVPAERSGGMRFFLSRTSEVEKAPSIGPRTAQMMEAIGVRTVEDLLSMAPDRLAEKLNHRRITASIIHQWQAQSRLMCQIPELRGHDAQILVACHISTPEGLAAQKPAELYALVEPFSQTKEGERIIRTGRKPDLAEVTEWIQWAANARSLRAA